MIRNIALDTTEYTLDTSTFDLGAKMIITLGPHINPVEYFTVSMTQYSFSINQSNVQDPVQQNYTYFEMEKCDRTRFL